MKFVPPKISVINECNHRSEEVVSGNAREQILNSMPFDDCLESLDLLKSSELNGEQRDHVVNLIDGLKTMNNINEYVLGYLAGIKELGSKNG